jgi:hypothetical protein
MASGFLYVDCLKASFVLLPDLDYSLPSLFYNIPRITLDGVNYIVVL